MTADGKIPVAILGATGMVGQRFIALLDGHPSFRVTRLAASKRSAGQRYGDACRWSLPTDMPEWAQGLVVEEATDALTDIASSVRLAFSSLDADTASGLEPAYAHAGVLVVSNASAHRMDPAVPLIVAEVNADHLELLRTQRFDGGGLVSHPNCSATGLVLALAPLHRAFGVERVSVTTLQAVSGAGYPDVRSADLEDNVVPFIASEEEKLAEEPGKILGELVTSAGGPSVAPASFDVSAQCFRVPVTDGHTLAVSVKLKGNPAPDAVARAWGQAAGDVPIRYMEASDRPQPRLDRDFQGGMGISIGRLRPCPVLGLRFVVLSHNTVRGGAGGAISAAEAALARGLIGG